MSKEKPSTKRRPPARTPEAREKQMVSFAMDLAEKQLLDGTASSQVIAHFLKIGSSKATLEQEIMVEEKKLITAKTDNLSSSVETKEIYENAIKAMKTYQGGGD